MIEFALRRTGLISRDEARNRPKIDRGVLFPNVGNHFDAVLLPILANVGQEIFRQPISRTRRPARARFSARYKTAIVISAHQQIPFQGSWLDGCDIRFIALEMVAIM